MIPVYAVGDAGTAIRLLAGRAILVSHAYIGSFVPVDKLADLRTAATELWCDSGAFTYWNRERKGEATSTITVDAWAEFIIAHGDRFDFFITLDEIGNASGSMENWLRLLAMVPKHLHPKLVPVWHEGDPIEHLVEYRPAERLVGLGRTKGRLAGPAGKKATLEFYDAAFNEYPDGIYHLLGNCNPDTIEGFDARSFDATTWQRDSAYGNSHGWPWCAVTKETRMRAYIEAIATIRYRPRTRAMEQQLITFDKAV
jgi:hypothetical protein